MEMICWAAFNSAVKNFLPKLRVYRQIQVHLSRLALQVTRMLLNIRHSHTRDDGKESVSKVAIGWIVAIPGILPHPHASGLA
jgi:hypothetical protein